ncbi:MAG: hypothetical protein ABIR78_06925 [Ferruginibacter sp.]
MKGINRKGKIKLKQEIFHLNSNKYIDMGYWHVSFERWQEPFEGW